MLEDIKRDLLGSKSNMVYAYNAAQNNWLVDTSNFQYISTQYTVNHTQNMNFKASIKPFNSLRIDLSADRNLMENRTANLGVENQSFALLNNQFNGSFSTSIITWKTAFQQDRLNDTTLSNPDLGKSFGLSSVHIFFNVSVKSECCKYLRK